MYLKEIYKYGTPLKFRYIFCIKVKKVIIGQHLKLPEKNSSLKKEFKTNTFFSEII